MAYLGKHPGYKETNPLIDYDISDISPINLNNPNPLVLTDGPYLIFTLLGRNLYNLIIGRLDEKSLHIDESATCNEPVVGMIMQDVMSGVYDGFEPHDIKLSQNNLSYCGISRSKSITLPLSEEVYDAIKREGIIEEKNAMFLENLFKQLKQDSFLDSTKAVTRK